MSARPPRSVVITGTSSGIGRAASVRLARDGWRVFAGVRRPGDGESLVREAGSAVHPILLEVTDASSIHQAEKDVGEALAGAPLDAVVNNAGISVGGPVELVETDDLRRQFEVNVFGAMAVTRAFLPRLRAARGRIVHISSGARKASTPMLGAYCASKHALEALADAMRVELRRAGVHVVLVEPGLIRTPFIDKGRAEARRELETWPEEARAYYGPAVEQYMSQVERLERMASEPDVVAQVVQRALEATSPSPRYTAGLDVKFMLPLKAALPDRWTDAMLGRLMGF